MEESRRAFINIITGGINTGKTKKLLSTYQKIGQGDGFIIFKVFDRGLYVGQRIMRLSTSVSENFSFKEGFTPINWDEEYRYDVFSFSKKGLMFAHETIYDILENGNNPVFIDEIGPLELQKKGFFNIFTALIKMEKDIYVTIRSSCVENVINEFKIEKYKVIKV